MKKKITLITSILLIIALAVTFVGCNKDKTEETPTTEASEKVSTTEPTTKFEAPEIKDEPTTEETTKEVETTKKVVSTNSGSSSSGSSNSSSGNKGTSSTTKANSNVVTVTGEKTTNKDGLSGYYVSDNIFFIDDESVTGGHSVDNGYDWDEDGDIDADDKEFEDNISWELE